MSVSTSSDWRQQLREFPWRSVGWLTIGLGILAVCFVLWVSLQITERVVVEADVPPVDTEETPIAWSERPFGEHLGALSEAVPLLDLTKKVVPVGQRAPEFRGTEFLKANANSWTLQVMNVSQEAVVKDYLAQRKDRNRFQYFRTVDGQQERYVLTYGVFNAVQTAMGALQSMDFELPNSVKAYPERFSSYQKLVTDQGAEERMNGVTRRVRELQMREVPMPVQPDPEVLAAARAARTERSSITQEPAFGALPGEQARSGISPPTPPRPVETPAPAGTVSPESAQTLPTTLPPVQDPFN
ncbi:MAG: hypothetical protein VXW65_11345 [Pseudomonadota bacterium]|nr:hypothetical protein [Pseudomonadota bacterium]